MWNSSAAPHTSSHYTARLCVKRRRQDTERELKRKTSTEKEVEEKRSAKALLHLTQTLTFTTSSFSHRSKTHQRLSDSAVQKLDTLVKVKAENDGGGSQLWWVRAVSWSEACHGGLLQTVWVITVQLFAVFL